MIAFFGIKRETQLVFFGNSGIQLKWIPTIRGSKNTCKKFLWFSSIPTSNFNFLNDLQALIVTNLEEGEQPFYVCKIPLIFEYFHLKFQFFKTICGYLVAGLSKSLFPNRGGKGTNLFTCAKFLWFSKISASKFKFSNDFRLRLLITG